jgi:hypothetical protein
MRAARGIFSAVLAALALAACAAAQSRPAGDPLSRPAGEFNVKNKPLADAFAEVESRSGIRILIDPRVPELMPYGPQTRININVKGGTLGEGLGRALESLGLRLSVAEDRVLVLPDTTLERLGRRLTAAEGQLLGKLASKPWKSLLDADEVRAEFRIDPAADPKAALDRALGQVNARTSLRQLEAACQALGWSWRLDGGKQIVFETRLADYRRRIDFPIEVRFQREPLERVLPELGSRVGLAVSVEPGALDRSGLASRPVTLVQRGRSLRQTLDEICGSTGLTYSVTDDGIRFTAPPAPPQPIVEVSKPSAAAAETIRLLVTIRPGLSVIVEVPLAQLSPELRDEIESKVRAALSEKP